MKKTAGLLGALALLVVLKAFWAPQESQMDNEKMLSERMEARGLTMEDMTACLESDDPRLGLRATTNNAGMPDGYWVAQDCLFLLGLIEESEYRGGLESGTEWRR